MEKIHTLEQDSLGENTRTHTHTQTSKCNEKNKVLSLVLIGLGHDVGGECNVGGKCNKRDIGGEHNDDAGVGRECNDGGGRFVHPSWRIGQGATMVLVLIATWCSSDIRGEHGDDNGGEHNNGSGG